MAKQQPNTVPRTSTFRDVLISDLLVDPEAQRPFDQAWVQKRVVEFDADKLGIILVNRRPNGKLYVVDGQHRVGLLRAVGWGDQIIKCEMFDGLTVQEEARKFLERNDRKSVQTFDKFRIRVRAGDTTACDIDRIVRAQGLVVDIDEDDGCVRAVAALERIYGGAGLSSTKESPAALARTLKMIGSAWGRQASSFNGKIIEGVGLVQLRYDGALDQEALTKKLSTVSGGAPGVLARAKHVHEMKGRPLHHCVAAVVVDVYNQGRRAGKVDEWWS